MRSGKGARRPLPSFERRWLPILLVVPAVGLLVAVGLYPLIFSLRVSLYQWNLMSPGAPRFIWLQNYAKIFHDPLALQGAWITTVMILAVVLVQLPLGTMLALLVNSLPRGSQVLATLLAIPMVLAPSVVGFQWVNILNEQYGPLDYVLSRLRLPAPAWTANPHLALPSLIVIDTWEWTPLIFLLVLAGLQAIPPQVIEAARTDGSRSWQVLTYVTLPLLKPVVAIALILRILATIKNLDLVYIVTAGGPGTATESLAYYSYVQGFKYFNIGYAAALAFVQLVVVIILVRNILRYMSRVSAA